MGLKETNQNAPLLVFEQQDSTTDATRHKQQQTTHNTIAKHTTRPVNVTMIDSLHALIVPTTSVVVGTIQVWSMSAGR